MINKESECNMKETLILKLNNDLNEKCIEINQLMDLNNDINIKYQSETHQKIDAKNKLIEADTKIDALNDQIRSFKTLHQISDRDIDLLKARLDVRDNKILGHKQELQNFQERNNKMQQDNLGFQVTKKELDEYISRILKYAIFLIHLQCFALISYK